MLVFKARKRLKTLQDEMSNITDKMSRNTIIRFTSDEIKAEAVKAVEGKTPVDLFVQLTALNTEICELKAKLTKANEQDISVDGIGQMTVNSAIFRLKQVTSLIYTCDTFSRERNSSTINNLGQREVTETSYDVNYFIDLKAKLVEEKENLQEAIDRFNLTFEV